MKLIFTILAFALCVRISHANTISYLRFEEGSGFGAWDETGLMNGEVLGFYDVDPGGGDSGGQGWSVSVPSPTVPLTGEANTGSMRLGGGAGFIDLSTVNALSLGMEFTIEMFFRPDQPTITSSMFGLSPSSSLYWALSETAGDLFFAGWFQDELVNDSASMVAVDEWQHFALVVESTDYSIYIDGQVQDAAPIPTGGEGPYWFPGTGTTGDRTMGDGFSGWLDEFRISDEALSPNQFLNAAIPEPATTALLAVGGLLLVFRRRRK